MRKEFSLKDAEFGDKFITRCGDRAVYLRKYKDRRRWAGHYGQDIHDLRTEDGFLLRCYDEGHAACSWSDDVVKREGEGGDDE